MERYSRFWYTERCGNQFYQRMVGGTIHGRGSDPGIENSRLVAHEGVATSTGSQANAEQRRGHGMLLLLGFCLDSIPILNC